MGEGDVSMVVAVAAATASIIGKRSAKNSNLNNGQFKERTILRHWTVYCMTVLHLNLNRRSSIVANWLLAPGDHFSILGGGEIISLLFLSHYFMIAVYLKLIQDKVK